MAVPTYDEFIPALLHVLAAHPDGMRSRDAYEAVAEKTQLAAADRALLLPSGGQAVYQNRIGWAHDRLKRAGYSTALRRGFWKITERGAALAAGNPKGLSRETLDGIAFLARSSKVADGATNPAVQRTEPPPPLAGPEERIDDAIEELHDSVARDLLAMIGDGSPAFFERLVLDLLLAMGYGASRSDLQQVGGVSDGGIDGIITLDRLGLEKVYVQAKRWKGTVGRPDVQGFFGALAGRRARKGVFITTSTYTAEARGFAESVADSMVIVDGRELAAYMIEHAVGVSHRTVRMARLDGDYFEEA